MSCQISTSPPMALTILSIPSSASTLTVWPSYCYIVIRLTFSSPHTDFLRVLDDLEHFAKDAKDPAAEASVQEARSKLDKLIGKMDSLESGFDRIAERSCTFAFSANVRLALTFRADSALDISALKPPTAKYVCTDNADVPCADE